MDCWAKLFQRGFTGVSNNYYEGGCMCNNNNDDDDGGSEDGGKLPLKSKWVSRWAKMALRRKDDDGDSLDEPGDFDDEF